MEKGSKNENKGETEKISFLKRIFISFIAFLLISILVTHALQDKIFFSVFAGIPAGIIAFLITFIYLGYKVNSIQK